MMAEGKTPNTIKYNELLNDGPWLAMFQEAVFGQGVEKPVMDGQQKFAAILDSK
jgi:multiple sugar transport system substrate-binding protein